MNETVRPQAFKRAAPAFPDTIAPTRPSRLRPRALGRVGIVVLVTLAAIVAWRILASLLSDAPHGASRPRFPPPTVRVAPVVRGDMPIALKELGSVAPLETVTIRTQIAGKLMSLGFKEGQMIKQGDFIAQIDPRPYQAALAQMKGQLAKDKALLAQARSNLDRYEMLKRQDSIAKQQVADQDALVAQDTAVIATDEALVETAKLNLDYTRITSPVDGRVGIRLVDPGNFLQPADVNGIVVITQLDPISVVFSVPEDDLPRIAARLKAGASLPVEAFNRASTHPLATGVLTTYDSQVDATTGTIKMRAIFANADTALFPQQFVNVRLLVDTLKGATLAPTSAVQVGPSGEFVYVVSEDSMVSRRAVTVGPSAGEFTSIKSGVTANERVVIDGVDRLRDGVKVNVAGPLAGSRMSAPLPGRASQGSGGPAQPLGAPRLRP